MTLTQALEKLDILQRKKAAYKHAIGMINYDAVTGGPVGGAANRGETLSILSAVDYQLQAGPETVELLDFLKAHMDELDARTRRMVELLRKDLDETSCIPEDEYVAYQKLISEADAVWHECKNKSDYETFAPYIEKIVETQKKFVGYIKPGMDPYAYYLDSYEPGVTVESADAFFAALRARIVPLLKKVQAAKQVDASFLRGDYPVEKQRAFSGELMDVLGIDRRHCILEETEHPFTSDFTKYDVRITTHYYPDNACSSMYSVIHEGGHALYELNTADEDAYTCLGTGVSMGIHESQSRFYENIIGRSRGFISYVAPRLRKHFPQLENVDNETLYRACNRCQASLIRIEADELTYCLHIMVRYELEKKLFAGELSVAELPDAWNRLYEEYLGVTPSCAREGVLQDSHWAGGCFGYFPSYALGSAYGAQMLAKMRETIDVDACAASGDLAPVTEWLRKNIWQYGCRYKPVELLERVLGEPFNPDYYLDYLEKKFSEIYAL